MVDYPLRSPTANHLERCGTDVQGDYGRVTTQSKAANRAANSPFSQPSVIPRLATFYADDVDQHNTDGL